MDNVTRCKCVHEVRMQPYRKDYRFPSVHCEVPNHKAEWERQENESSQYGKRLGRVRRRNG